MLERILLHLNKSDKWYSLNPDQCVRIVEAQRLIKDYIVRNHLSIIIIILLVIIAI